MLPEAENGVVPLAAGLFEISACFAQSIRANGVPTLTTDASASNDLGSREDEKVLGDPLPSECCAFRELRNRVRMAVTQP